MNHVPEAQRGVTGEHHAGLTELTAEVSVNAGVVLQLVGLDQLKQQQQQRWMKTLIFDRKDQITFSATQSVVHCLSLLLFKNYFLLFV